MKLRQAVNEKCADCCHDPLDKGTRAQQIAACTSSDCPLHSVRPITATTLPASLLRHWGIKRSDLCERARAISLDEKPDLSPVEGQIEPLASTASISGGVQ
jgi:hypothetical protein